MQDTSTKNPPHHTRHRSWQWHTLCLLLATSLPAIATGQQTNKEVRVNLSDQPSPPYIMGSGEQLPAKPGLIVELALAAASQCQLQLKLERQPAKRLLSNLASGKNAASLQLSHTPERAGFASYPQQNGQLTRTMRISTLRYMLYVKTGSPLKWDGKQLTPSDAIVGSNLGWSINNDLEKLGIHTETAISVDSNFNKLLAGRVDAYAGPEVLGNNYLANQSLQTKIQALPVLLKEKDYFMPFNLDYARQNPQTVQCMWQQIAKLRDPLFRTRLKHYLDN